MRRSITGEAQTVYNKPFFVNELLTAIQPVTISPIVFDEMVEESRVFDLSTILTAMTRQIDISGVIPNLVGVYNDPQDVLQELMNLGHIQLLKISRLDEDLQVEIFDTLKANGRATLRALLVLDQYQREVIDHLVQIRSESPLALALRQATEEAVRELYQRAEKIYSPTFDEVICYGDRELMYHGEPRICYPKRIANGAVVEVWQYFFMPKIEDIHLPKPFQDKNVGQILSHITPRFYQRKISDDTFYDPQTPAGFIGLLGKVGGAFPRFIAMQVKKNEQLRRQVMQEQEAAEALHDLFTQ